MVSGGSGSGDRDACGGLGGLGLLLLGDGEDTCARVTWVVRWAAQGDLCDARAADQPPAVQVHLVERDRFEAGTGAGLQPPGLPGEGRVRHIPAAVQLLELADAADAPDLLAGVVVDDERDVGGGRLEGQPATAVQAATELRRPIQQIIVVATGEPDEGRSGHRPAAALICARRAFAAASRSTRCRSRAAWCSSYSRRFLTRPGAGWRTTMSPRRGDVVVVGVGNVRRVGAGAVGRVPVAVGRGDMLNDSALVPDEFLAGDLGEVAGHDGRVPNCFRVHSARARACSSGVPVHARSGSLDPPQQRSDPHHGVSLRVGGPQPLLERVDGDSVVAVAARA